MYFLVCKGLSIHDVRGVEGHTVLRRRYGRELVLKPARVVPREPPPLFFTEIAGFETSSRPYLLKYGDP